jgi:hypothetical protein
MISPATLQEIKELCANPNYISYCVIWTRPGVLAWAVELEYTKFKPDTELNDDFHMSTMKWPEDLKDLGLLYTIVTFHKSEQEFAESLLWKNGLRKVTEIGPEGVKKFPLSGPSIFFLENHSKGASNVIYTNDPVKLKAAHEHEVAQCQVFFDAHQAWLKTPEGKATADAYWKQHPKGFNI